MGLLYDYKGDGEEEGKFMWMVTYHIFFLILSKIFFILGDLKKKERKQLPSILDFIDNIKELKINSNQKKKVK